MLNEFSLVIFGTHLYYDRLSSTPLKQNLKVFMYRGV